MGCPCRKIRSAVTRYVPGGAHLINMLPPLAEPADSAETAHVVPEPKRMSAINYDSIRDYVKTDPSWHPKRRAVIDEAKSWLGTPFHHEAKVKGAGVDCGQLLEAVYEHTGCIPYVEVAHYPADFYQHRDQEWYLEEVLKWATEIGGPPGPADVALYKQGRIYSHGVIVVSWPWVIHAFSKDGVMWADGTQGWLGGRSVRFFRPHAFDVDAA